MKCFGRAAFALLSLASVPVSHAFQIAEIHAPPGYTGFISWKNSPNGRFYCGELYQETGAPDYLVHHYYAVLDRTLGSWRIAPGQNNPLNTIVPNCRAISNNGVAAFAVYDLDLMLGYARTFAYAMRAGISQGVSVGQWVQLQIPAPYNTLSQDGTTQYLADVDPRYVADDGQVLVNFKAVGDTIPSNLAYLGGGHIVFVDPDTGIPGQEILVPNDPSTPTIDESRQRLIPAAFDATTKAIAAYGMYTANCPGGVNSGYPSQEYLVFKTGAGPLRSVAANASGIPGVDPQHVLVQAQFMQESQAALKLILVGASLAQGSIAQYTSALKIYVLNVSAAGSMQSALLIPGIPGVIGQLCNANAFDTHNKLLGTCQQGGEDPALNNNRRYVSMDTDTLTMTDISAVLPLSELVDGMLFRRHAFVTTGFSSNPTHPGSVQTKIWIPQPGDGLGL